MKILNLTQHIASQEQVEAGVFEPSNKQLVKELLTFDTLPSAEEIKSRVTVLTGLAMQDCTGDFEAIAMIGGAPFLMPLLEAELRAIGIKPVYAFSQRVVEEDPTTGQKISVFRHVGFIEGLIT